MSSVHDNFIFSYNVNAQNKEIRLQTAYLDGGNDERAEIVFREVAAYHFECDNFSNVIFDIEEEELGYICDKNAALFERNKNYGWPCFDNSRSEILKQMQQADVRGFVINSSSGLCGWVWAKTMELIVACDE